MCLVNPVAVIRTAIQDAFDEEGAHAVSGFLNATQPDWVFEGRMIARWNDLYCRKRLTPNRNREV